MAWLACYISARYTRERSPISVLTGHDVELLSRRASRPQDEDKPSTSRMRANNEEHWKHFHAVNTGINTQAVSNSWRSIHDTCRYFGSVSNRTCNLDFRPSAIRQTSSKAYGHDGAYCCQQEVPNKRTPENSSVYRSSPSA